MLTHTVRFGAAVLSGVTASLLIATAAFAAQEKPVVVYAEPQEGFRSERVTYADLDLSTKAGKDELRHRVALTARYLCGKLGESDNGSPVVTSCRDAATKDALTRVGTIEEGFAPRGTTWVAGTRWQPPYPADWVERYP